MVKGLLEKKTEEDNCSFLSENLFCNVFNGQSHPFNPQKYSKCIISKKEKYCDCKKYTKAVNNISNLLSGLPFHIIFYENNINKNII